MHTRKITFDNASGHQLAALLDMPAEGEPVAYVLFAHCFTCSKDYKGVVRISKALAAQGFGVLRFDFTGLGESEGDFAETTFSSNVADLVAAAEFMGGELEAPKVLVGHSLGGAAVILAAHRISSVVAVATLAAPANLNILAGRLRSQTGDFEGTGEAVVVIGGRSIRIGKDLVDDLEAVNMREAVSRMGKALLICHSPADRTVDIESAVEIFSAAQHPKSFLSIGDADHLCSNPEDGRYIGTMLATWATRAISPS